MAGLFHRERNFLHENISPHLGTALIVLLLIVAGAVLLIIHSHPGAVQSSPASVELPLQDPSIPSRHIQPGQGETLLQALDRLQPEQVTAGLKDLRVSTVKSTREALLLVLQYSDLKPAEFKALQVYAEKKLSLSSVQKIQNSLRSLPESRLVLLYPLYHGMLIRQIRLDYKI